MVGEKGDISIRKIEIIVRIQENGKIEKEIPILNMEFVSNQKLSMQEQILTFDNLTIDFSRRKVYLKKQEINLTPKEFDILFFLASYPGQVFTHHQIYESVWDKEYVFDEGNITAHIGRIRKKIEPDPRHPVYILTVRGVGYKFRDR